jgi:mono/diheme cytochrome c family protein
MRITLRKFLVGAALAALLVAGGVLGAIQLRWKRTFDAPYPSIAASTDPAIIEQGRYLTYGPAACAYCHLPREEWSTLARGAMPPLTGNHLFRLPLGELYSPNITSDAETGIGRRTDGELARVLRHGVRADGRAAFPLMSYGQMSDADLTAVISFLRSQPPARLAVPDHQLTLLGKALMAFAIAPETLAEPPQQASPAGPSAARGEYLANSLSSCVECHTDRDPQSGSFVGPKFAGGQRMDLAADSTKVAVPPNLTPDPKTSPIGRWDEDVFVSRFRVGETVAGTPMPWGAYARMNDEDLRGVYRYLRSLPPVEHETGAPVQEK